MYCPLYYYWAAIYTVVYNFLTFAVHTVLPFREFYVSWSFSFKEYYQIFYDFKSHTISGIVVETQFGNLATGVQVQWTSCVPGAGPKLHNCLVWGHTVPLCGGVAC